MRMFTVRINLRSSKLASHAREVRMFDPRSHFHMNYSWKKQISHIECAVCFEEPQVACRTPCTFGVCLEFPRIFWNILLAHPDKSWDHRVSLPGCGQNQCPHPVRHEPWPQHALSFPYPAKARTSFRYPAVARTSYPAVARLAYRQWPEPVSSSSLAAHCFCRSSCVWACGCVFGDLHASQSNRER